jgi:DDE superfamily endonuclease
VFALVAGRFFRREVRVRARACLGGMLSGLERKTAWSLAEHAGEATPDGMQRLFTTARWDAGRVRDDVRGYVAAALGDPDGVLIGDDTGFEKGGYRSAGVQRQYTGTAGKITNCQLGVFLAYASPMGRALVERELYLDLPRTFRTDQVLFAVIAVLGFILGKNDDRWLATWGGAGVGLIMGLIIVALIPVVPFTEQFAGETTPQAYWSSPTFKKINRVISAAWGAAIFGVGISCVAAAAVNGHTTRRLPDILLGLVVPGVIILYMLKFSKSYPDRVTHHEPAQAAAGQ